MRLDIMANKKVTKTVVDHGIKKLSDWEHVRLKNEMYYGSRNAHSQLVVMYEDMQPVLREVSWVPALYVTFREVLDNALDEIIGHGFGSRIVVDYDPETRIVSIEDDGRGIPIDYDEAHKCYLATLVTSECRAGRNFGERGESVGTNGIGVSGVNFCSEFFKLDIHRDGQRFQQEFREGVDALQILPPKIKKVTGTKTGTRVTFRLSAKVFHDLTMPLDFIRSRVTEVAICNPNLKIIFNGDTIRVKPRQEQTIFPNTKPITIEFEEGTIRTKWWITHGNDDSEHIHSLVNNIPVFNGGVHVDAFRRLFYTGMISALERESKRRKLVPNRSDIQDGLFIYNITNMAAPNFDSQSKTRLINEEVASVFKKRLDDEAFYRDLIKRSPDWINTIYERCAARTMKKDAADLIKINKAGKKVKVEKLNDAIGLDRQKCILFLAEGDSAIAGFNNARDKNIHGALPLGGKVLNCHPSKSTLKIIAANEALLQITRSIGLSIGVRANRFSLRYGKVFITCDADEDGKDIASLLVNFFYQLWPELFDAANPFLYVFDTPLIIAAKGKQRKYWYNDTYHEFDLAAMKGWEITRAKGLAALQEVDWQNALDTPRATAITEDAEGSLKSAMDLLFNTTRADDRKKWMGI